MVVWIDRDTDTISGVRSKINYEENMNEFAYT